LARLSDHELDIKSRGLRPPHGPTGDKLTPLALTGHADNPPDGAWRAAALT